LTADIGRTILRQLRVGHTRNMNEIDITKLENQVDELIEICGQLKDENTFLRDRQDLLVEERARLIEKADMARNRVEGILTRLKAMEQQA